MSLVKNGDQGYESRCEIAEFMIGKCPGMLERLDENGRSCLHIAAEGDQVGILEVLLKTMTLKLGHSRAVECLLQKDKSQMKCLHKVFISKGSDVFMFLLEKTNLEALGFDVLRFGFDVLQVPQLCRDLLRYQICLWCV